MKEKEERRRRNARGNKRGGREEEQRSRVGVENRVVLFAAAVFFCSPSLVSLFRSLSRARSSFISLSGCRNSPISRTCHGILNGRRWSRRESAEPALSAIDENSPSFVFPLTRRALSTFCSSDTRTEQESTQAQRRASGSAKNEKRRCTRSRLRFRRKRGTKSEIKKRTLDRRRGCLQNLSTEKKKREKERDSEKETIQRAEQGGTLICFCFHRHRQACSASTAP